MAALSIQLPFPVFTDADGQPVEFSGAASGASTDWYVDRAGLGNNLGNYLGGL